MRALLHLKKSREKKNSQIEQRLCRCKSCKPFHKFVPIQNLFKTSMFQKFKNSNIQGFRGICLACGQDLIAINFVFEYDLRQKQCLYTGTIQNTINTFLTVITQFYASHNTINLLSFLIFREFSSNQAHAFRSFY